VDNVTEINQTFTSAASAVAYFSDNAMNLGSLAAAPFTANTLTMQAVLTVTTDSEGSGFYGGIIIGDPPKARLPARSLVDAMATFGPAAAGGDRQVSWTRPAPLLLAAASHGVIA